MNEPADDAAETPAPTERGGTRRRRAPRAEPSLLIGDSEAIRRVARMAEDVARSNVTVLIQGESGTGKELVARIIHEHSARAEKPFIFVNCAALPEQLVEAELFGHTKGAFTDARADKPGRFTLADGGTLFLDEIGDLPPKGQGDLLRVLEDGAFRTVGGTELVHVDVRIVAATNQKLDAAVAAGKFREDLFYRLHVIPIEIPPLRDRPDDVPVLVEMFLAHFGTKHQLRGKHLSAEALRLFQRFAWPGNVRQLRNIVERLVITCPRATIEVEDLPDYMKATGAAAPEFTLRPGMTLAEVERILIEQTLRHVTSNREAAAKQLGISRRALQYKLKHYGLLDQP
jgi:transcriptional regulator with PAS, ATPase and Fis domain